MHTVILNLLHCNKLSTACHSQQCTWFLLMPLLHWLHIAQCTVKLRSKTNWCRPQEYSFNTLRAVRTCQSQLHSMPTHQHRQSDWQYRAHVVSQCVNNILLKLHQMKKHVPDKCTQHNKQWPNRQTCWLIMMTMMRQVSMNYTRVSK